MEKDNTYKMTYKVIGWTWWGDTDYVEASLTDEVVDAVVKEIRKCGYCFGGDSHQYRDGCVPVLSTGEVVKCSMREWGAIMSMAFFDGVRFPLDYMGWYMGTCIEDDALKYPEEGVDEHLFTHPHYFKTGITHKRFESLKTKGKVLHVLATSDENTNVDVSDIGIFWDYGCEDFDQLQARVMKIKRFKNPEEFIKSDVFEKTDLADLTGHELKVAINSAWESVPIQDDEEITVYYLELIDIIPDRRKNA